MTPLMRTKLALIVLTLTAAPLVADESPPPWANKFFLANIDQNPTQRPPHVISHDFGTVPKGTLCVRRFTVTNIYDVPMQVVDIRRSCGCLQAYAPEKVLQPHESEVFTVTMDTAQFTGANARTIDVTFRGSREGTEFSGKATLNIRAYSRPDVSLSPGTVEFGAVALGAKPTQSLTLEYTGIRREGWKVIGVVPPVGPLEVEVRDAGRGLLGAKYYVNVTLKADAPAGPISELITLKTNDPSAPLVHVNVSGIVQAPLSVSSDRLHFPKTKVGEESSVKVLVRANNSVPFLIQPIPDDGNGVWVETFPGKAPVQIVTVKFKPTKPGLTRWNVLLSTDLNGGATVRLQVEGEAE